MVLSSPQHTSGPEATPKRLTVSFIVSVMALCAKQASKVSNKLKTSRPSFRHRRGHLYDAYGSPKESPRSPLATPKRLFSQISNKAMGLAYRNQERKRHVGDDEKEDENGDGGVWQKAILMGDKCQPLDFSGVIYYDSSGKQVNEVPLRSPRASPLPGYLTRR